MYLALRFTYSIIVEQSTSLMQIQTGSQQAAREAKFAVHPELRDHRET